MRWLELLVAGIFTYEVTHSTVLVALVTVARSLPMLFIGTIAGVVGEALNRKRLLLTQLFVMAVNSSVLCALAFSAQIRVWHIAVGGIAAGIVWAMELAVRRRMIGEVVAPDQVAPAVAFDSLTNSFARVLGPLAGGAAYQTLGLGGAYFLSAALYLAAGLTVSGLDFRQEPRQAAVWPNCHRHCRSGRGGSRQPGDTRRRAGIDHHEHVCVLLFRADRTDRARCVSGLAYPGRRARCGGAARRHRDRHPTV